MISWLKSAPRVHLDGPQSRRAGLSVPSDPRQQYMSDEDAPEGGSDDEDESEEELVQKEKKRRRKMGTKRRTSAKKKSKTTKSHAVKLSEADARMADSTDTEST